MSAERRQVHDVPALRDRSRDSHKGNYGSVLVAAGSRFMPGAAVLAARAAYRAGAGLVTVLSDTEVIPTIAAGVCEAVFTDWAEIGKCLAINDSVPHDSVLIGPGLGTEDRGRLVLDLILRAESPVVVDADALNIIARDIVSKNSDALPPRDDRIWTPHPGEFERLTGQRPRSKNERLDASKAFVERFGGVLVLKGHGTVIADYEQFAINESGNPGMATAGSGDVLAGMLAVFLGQGYTPFDAARLAVHLHGAAGDGAAERFGEASLTASDIVDELPEVMKSHPHEQSRI